MSWADGARTLQIPKAYNGFIRMLVDEGFARSNMHVLELAISIGLRYDERVEASGEMHDAAKVGQMDPDGILSAAILHRYGDLEERERGTIVTEHAIAGLERLMEHFEGSGTTLNVPGMLSD